MNRIKELRKEQGKSLEEVAEAVGISRTTVNFWENEKTEPSKENWEALAKFFGVMPGYLIGWSDDEKSTGTGRKKTFHPETNIGLIRQELGLNKKEFGNLVNKHWSNIDAWENKRRFIGKTSAVKIATVLKVNAAFLLDLTNNRDPHLLDDVEADK